MCLRSTVAKNIVQKYALLNEQLSGGMNIFGSLNATNKEGQTL